MSTNGESPDESVDGIEQIPSANDHVFKSDVVEDSAGGASNPGESQKQRIGIGLGGSDNCVDRRRVCVTSTPDQGKLDKDHRTWKKNND